MATAFPALEMPDAHYVRSALGWLELGIPAEALAELSKVTKANHTHPDHLEALFSVHAATANWDEGLNVSKQLIESAPERINGWIHWAYSLRRMTGGSVEKAEAVLEVAAGKFPKEPLIPYNLACYAAVQGKESRAWDLLNLAMEVSGDLGEIKKMALADADLTLLWSRIREL